MPAAHDFLFYVLEHHVDPTVRYTGIIALIRALAARRSRASSGKA
jgi:hypothetical protein